MKRIARIGALVLALALMLSLAACGGPSRNGGQAPAQSQGQESGKSLYDHGLEVIGLMAEMARTEDYRSLLSSSPELTALLIDAGQGDFTAPKTVYRITVPLSAALSFAGEETGLDLDNFSPALRDVMEKKLLTAFPTQINAQAGSTVLAASSICTAQTFFVSSELTEDVIYLYTFENAVPAAVTFLAGEGGAVSASGMLILNSSFDLSQDVSEYMDALGITVEEVTP